MQIFKEIINLKSVQHFVRICELIAEKKTNSTLNGIGVNFSKNEIESVKFYYGFHHKLSLEDIKRLHVYGSTETFFRLESQLEDLDYNWHNYLPTGVSFALKIDKYFKESMGHFMMPKIQMDDLFFSLPKVKNYFIDNQNLPIINRKGIFTLINDSGIEHHKDYFYVNNPILKKQIGEDYGVKTDLVPSIEWVLGKGYYDGSSPNDEKIVLQSNYKEVYDQIIKNDNWEIIQKFNFLMSNTFNALCVCPGYYKNNEIKSYYYFKATLPSYTHLNTIPEILKNSHLI